MKNKKADPINNPQFSKASILNNLSLPFPRAGAGHLFNSPIKTKQDSFALVHHILSFRILYLVDFLVFVSISKADRNSLRNPWPADQSCPHHLSSPKAFIILYIITGYPGILYSDTFPHVGKLKWPLTLFIINFKAAVFQSMQI